MACQRISFLKLNAKCQKNYIQSAVRVSYDGCITSDLGIKIIEEVESSLP